MSAAECIVYPLELFIEKRYESLPNTIEQREFLKELEDMVPWEQNSDIVEELLMLLLEEVDTE